MVAFIKEGFTNAADGDIVFVCGGNDSSHMRPRFKEFCEKQENKLNIFFPESAMEDYFSSAGSPQFDIAEFETLIAEMSHAVVVFPEAAGSYAEVGYFSAIDSIASKTVLVLDQQYQGDDSFISLGPAKKIGAISVFRDVIYMPYTDPLFDAVVSRIRRISIRKNRKNLDMHQCPSFSSYDWLCVTSIFYEILILATIDDLVFMMKAVFGETIPKEKIKKFSSILVGAGYLQKWGDFGHYKVRERREKIFHVKRKFESEHTQIRLALAELHDTSDPDFRFLLEGEFADAA